MYAVGHLAWGYIAGKASSRALRIEAKAVALLLAAVLPDLDLVMHVAHRGPTHSLLLTATAFTVGFMIWGSRVAPYFAAIAQHSLIDALDQMGAQLLWPITSTRYSFPLAPMGGSVAIAAEWMGFLLSLTLMAKTRELMNLLRRDPSNLLAVVPLGALLFNAFIWRLPRELIIPTVSYLGILFLPVFADIRALTRGARRNRSTVGR